jgi:hypothetical protein
MLLCVYSFGHILPKMHEISRAFALKKRELFKFVKFVVWDYSKSIAERRIFEIRKK